MLSSVEHCDGLTTQSFEWLYIRKKTPSNLYCKYWEVLQQQDHLFFLPCSWTQVILISHGLKSPSNLSSSRRHFSPFRKFLDKWVVLWDRGIRNYYHLKQRKSIRLKPCVLNRPQTSFLQLLVLWYRLKGAKCDFVKQNKYQQHQTRCSKCFGVDWKELQFMIHQTHCGLLQTWAVFFTTHSLEKSKPNCIQINEQCGLNQAASSDCNSPLFSLCKCWSEEN